MPCWTVFRVVHHRAPLTVAGHLLTGVMPKNLAKKPIEWLLARYSSGALDIVGAAEVPTDHHERNRVTS